MFKKKSVDVIRRNLSTIADDLSALEATGHEEVYELERKLDTAKHEADRAGRIASKLKELLS